MSRNRSIWLIICLVALIMGSYGAALAGAEFTNDGNDRKGKYLYRKNCRSCHDGSEAAELSPISKTQAEWQKCILCKACMVACPYDARFVSLEHKAVEKCTLCIHRLQEGREPACVETCPSKVRVFGDLSDPKSEVSRLLGSRGYYRLKPDRNTRPRSQC